MLLFHGIEIPNYKRGADRLNQIFSIPLSPPFNDQDKYKPSSTSQFQFKILIFNKDAFLVYVLARNFVDQKQSHDFQQLLSYACRAIFLKIK